MERSWEMRFPIIKEEDAAAVNAVCHLCGNEIYMDEPYYFRDGETICEDCLEDYAQLCLAPFRIEGGCNR